jgi:hypothetical protein
MQPAHEAIVRELAHRTAGGLDVRLLWESASDRLTVSVTDERSGEVFEVAASPDTALHVFYHPYAYGRRGDAKAAAPESRLDEAA